jgi:hypothetical protein
MPSGIVLSDSKSVLILSGLSAITLRELKK